MIPALTMDHTRELVRFVANPEYASLFRRVIKRIAIFFIKVTEACPRMEGLLHRFLDSAPEKLRTGIDEGATTQEIRQSFSAWRVLSHRNPLGRRIS